MAFYLQPNEYTEYILKPCSKGKSEMTLAMYCAAQTVEGVKESTVFSLPQTATSPRMIK
jgi:hypothetical protein